MRRLVWQDLDERERSAVLQRPFPPQTQRDAVARIISEVRRRGDAALRDFARSFDSCELNELALDIEELREAAEDLPSPVVEALATAARNIEAFHRPQVRQRYEVKDADGMKLSRELRPISRIGLYIPGGSAPLLSTLLMLVIPARLAGCANIVLCTPPDREGRIDKNLLGAAYRYGISHVFKVGGAQAIAAMAYGTESIPKVDKIFGPGNSWVTEAKLLVSQDANGASIDMPAGPSELMVVADASSNPRFIASDLLSQAEHGVDSQVVLVSTDAPLIEKVYAEIYELARQLPRVEIIREALEHSVAILVKDRSEALALIDRYAPEHLSLQLEDPEHLIESISKAGSIFCGPWTPESAGDYTSGTNHVLPTGAWARSVSGLSVESFQRTMSVQTLSARSLLKMSGSIQTLAKVEGLAAHGLAVQVRVDSLRAAEEKGRV